MGRSRDVNEDDDDDGIRCPFGDVEVELSGTSIKALEEGTEIQVLAKQIYVGHKYKTTWKKLVNVEVDVDQGMIRLESEAMTVRAADPTSQTWRSFAKAVQTKWNKLQRKQERREEKEAAKATIIKTKTTTATLSTRTNKNRRSKASTFLLRNAQNMRDWESEDDEVFNRLPPKELAKRKQKATTYDDDDSEKENNAEDMEVDEVPADNTLDNNDNDDNDDDEEHQFGQEPEDQDATMENRDKGDADIASSPLKDKKKKKRRLKKLQRFTEDDDSEDDLFNEAPRLTTPLQARRIVSPGTTLAKTSTLEKEQQEDDEDETPSTTTSPRKSAGTIASFFQKASQKQEKVPTKQVSNFFAPRKTTTTTKIVVKPTEEEENPVDDDVGEIMEDDEPTITTPKPRTPKKMSPQVAFAYQSAKKLEASVDDDDDDEDTLVDSENDEPETTSHSKPTTVERRLGGQKRRLFPRTYGSKPVPKVSTAVMALEWADAQESKRQRPFVGMTTSPPSKTMTTPSPPKKPRKSPLVTTTATATTAYRGLKNLGNTCYMNASLQMLFSVPAFCRALLAFRPTTRLVEGFLQLYQDLQKSTEASSAVSPRALKAVIDTATDKFRGYQQRDAHEFLGDLLDQLHESLEEESSDKENQSPTESTSSSPSSSSSSSPLVSGKSTHDPLPTDRFFGLTVQVCLNCKSCGYKRTKEEFYRYLSVDIDAATSNGNKPTVQGCVERFFQPEDREINCEKCEEGKVATQTMKILSRPRAVLVHLKRFVLVEQRKQGGGDASSSGGAEPAAFSFQKNRDAVDLNETLTLDEQWKSKTGSPSGGSTSYSLQSVVHHIGNTANSGHYTADCLREREDQSGVKSRQWVSNDDAITSETTLSKVRGSTQNQRTAYMLLYSTS